jgi:hypoxanthine-guanine phosphoribosyltransferase
MAVEEAIPGRDVSFATYFHFDHFGSGPCNPERLSSKSIVQCRCKDVIIVDDMIDSSGTVAELSKKLQKEGASHIYVCASHGIFSGNALEELAKVRISFWSFPPRY